MEGRAESSVGFSHMATLATLSVVALASVSAWQVYQLYARSSSLSTENSVSALPEKASTPYGGVNWQAPLFDVTNASGEDDPDGLSNIEGNVARALLDSYTLLNQAGIYTPEDGEKIAFDIATSLQASVSYEIYSASDLHVDKDTSYERMLVYRNDLRIALEPLLANPGYELGLFANYIESLDPIYAERLGQAAENYKKAVAQAALVQVPEDAVAKHVGILNALSEFGSIVERMTSHADDAFAAAALLRTYNDSEAKLLTSFNSLASYYTAKQL